ncbi:hypothetical protein D3C80_1512980 [compost metagenome]
MSTDSDLRMPVPYSKAMIAASRTPCGRGSDAHTSISSRIRLRRRLRPGGRRLPVAGLTSRMRNSCSWSIRPWRQASFITPRMALTYSDELLGA